MERPDAAASARAPGFRADGFQLGLLLDGGTPVFPLGFAGIEPRADPTPPTLSANHSGGGGDEQEYRGSFTGWVWAPAGLPRSSQLVVEWRDFGVPEVRRVLEASLIDAIPEARRLWPDDEA
ncbi:hypothetical protein [Agromyces lapidis]|uniref:Uncharacterized protein n=1 Tax=Agromyces lapidis TaxID=279574 RepID=A0ABV5SWE0_9MICO|nr:hypothetical protein [Agromyces lapidis]